LDGKAMRALRLSLLTASLGLGVASLFMPAPAIAATQAAEFCEELEEATQSATDKAVEEIRQSDVYKEVEDERMSAFDCQMAVAGELSSWVQGSVGMGFLDSLFSEMTDYVSNKACDEFKARAREANRKLGQIDQMVNDLPQSLEEAKRLAQEAAERAAKEYAKQQVDDYISKLPKPTPHVQTPGYTLGGMRPTTGSGSSDPWGAIRDLWGSN